MSNIVINETDCARTMGLIYHMAILSISRLLLSTLGRVADATRRVTGMPGRVAGMPRRVAGSL